MTTRKMNVCIALREEGEFWNAYLARTNTMTNAKLIGSIVIGAVRKNPEAKAAFQSLMQLILADAVEEVTGQAPSEWHVEPGREAERSGHS